MKKFFSLIISAALVLGTASAVCAAEDAYSINELPFADVKEGDWFYDAVKEMYEEDLMGGTDGTKYEPQSEGKRGEIVCVLYRMDGSPKVKGELKFSDIGKGSELADAALWASENGIAAGYPEGTFKPSQSVSRQELAIFIYKYGQYRGLDLAAEGSLDVFKDKDSIGSWAKEAVVWAAGSGLISGMGDGTMAPKGTTTRAQLASLFNRLRKLEPIGDAPVDYFSNMPLGDYESKEMAREVSIYGDGTFKMLGGRGLGSTEPITGFWEADIADLGGEMYADCVYFYQNEEDAINGGAFMVWIYDGENFIVGPWEGDGILYEHMIRIKGPEIAVEGTWIALGADNTGTDSYVFSNGKWQALKIDGSPIASGTYSPAAGEENTYKLIDAEGKPFGTVKTLYNDWGFCINIAGVFFITESAVMG